MAQIPREIVDAVRDRTNLVELVGRHVTLAARGRSHVGLCPFHQEKTPSFHVIPAKGIFHCFGCQTGGDAYKFLMLIEGLSFVESVKELAGPAGITIEERQLTDHERRALRARSTLFDVLEEASKFFESELWTKPSGAVARDYLTQRGMTTEFAREAGLGWAPGGWTTLLDHLHRLGFAHQRVEEAGLAKQRNSGGHYDILRERLVVPIHDERGRTIAFGGRILQGDGPKYLNTPETSLYHKSRVLYGLNMARQGIQRKKRAIVVEGYFDVLSLHQAGFDETVATCGTALTEHHLERLRRLTRDVVLLMDADEAGLRASERSLPLFVSASIQPWRIDLPGAKDPDELVREEGAEALEKALLAKEPLLEWVVSKRLAAYGASTMSRSRVLDEVVPLLKKLADPTLISSVARRLDVREEQVLERIRQERSPQQQEQPAPRKGWKPHVDIVHLLWLLVHHYELVADLLADTDPSLLENHGPVRPAIARLLTGEPIASVLPDVEDEGVQRTLAAVVARQELYDKDEARVALVAILARLAKPLRIAKLATLTTAIEASALRQEFEAMREHSKAKKELIANERALEQALSAGEVGAALALIGAAH